MRALHSETFRPWRGGDMDVGNEKGSDKDSAVVALKFHLARCVLKCPSRIRACCLVRDFARDRRQSAWGHVSL